MKQYYQFWKDRLDPIKDLIDEAFRSGTSHKLDVSDLVKCGSRQNWSGRVELSRFGKKRGHEAHAGVLGNVLVGHHVIEPYGDAKFLFRISKNLELYVELLVDTPGPQSNLAHELIVRKNLTNYLEQINPYTDWDPGHRLSGYGVVDIFGESSKCVWIIELELKREDPVNNVAKIFRYVEEDGNEFKDKNIIFIHAFSLHYKPDSSKRMNAKFLGNKMAKQHDRISYMTIDFDSQDSLHACMCAILK